MSEVLKTIFLFGAGSSKPADLPLIDEMTVDFLKTISEEGKLPYSLTESDFRPSIEVVKNVTRAHFGKVDLEYMMTLLINLGNDKNKLLFQSTYPELKSVDDKQISAIQISISKFIRSRCENFDASKIDYLWTLVGLSDNGKMDIFTVNYDGIIEAFCEKKGINFTDGFAPNWNSKLFDSADIKIFKLHGSLYWLRSESGKFFKVPVKGLSVTDVKYLTDETVSEMMIYPALDKDKQSEVYLWLFRRFIDGLNQSDILVVIGYSFRDKEITFNIRDAINRNPRLWVVLVSPNAYLRKKECFAQFEDELSSRIVTAEMVVREAITERGLHRFLGILRNARQQEESIWNTQSKSTERMDTEWKWVIERYIDIRHYERVSWIYDQLSKQSFTKLQGKTEETLENVLGPISLQCIVFYHMKKDAPKMQTWKNIFLEYCIAFEYSFFDGNSSLQSNNPIKKESVPLWRIQKGFDGSIAKRDELLRQAQILQSITNDQDLLPAIEKFVRTLQHYTFKRNPEDEKSENMTAKEFLEKYSAEDLGLYKWAKRIIEYV
jgi:hypothetical protein